MDLYGAFELYQNVPRAPPCDYTEFLKRGPVAPPELVEVAPLDTTDQEAIAGTRAEAPKPGSAAAAVAAMSSSRSGAAMDGTTTPRHRMRPRERNPDAVLRDVAYRSYLRSCTAYLAEFMHRATPLQGLQELLAPAHAEYRKKAGLEAGAELEAEAETGTNTGVLASGLPSNGTAHTSSAPQP